MLRAFPSSGRTLAPSLPAPLGQASTPHKDPWQTTARAGSLAHVTPRCYLSRVGINIAQVIRPWALRSPTRTALILGTEESVNLSYGELDARACRAAAYLQALGLRPGARVALSMPNGLSFMDAFWGALYAGLTLIPVPPMSAPPELAARLRHARCAALITDARTRALGTAALQLLSPHATTTTELPGHIDALALSSHDGVSDGPMDLPAGAVALMLYTSGTTGTAKGALITHASLLTHTAALTHHALKLREDDIVLATLPLTHSYGIRMTLFAPFYAGARSVLYERFDAPRCLDSLRAHDVTWFPGVPTMFHSLVHTATGAARGWPELRWCMSAGAPLPPDIRKRFESRFGVPLRQGFGLTEATFSTLCAPDDDDGADSVGRPVFGVEVRVCDADGRSLPQQAPGEICIRGQNVMAGYFEDEAATQATIRDGFLRTGDVGMLDSEGRLFVVDRIKDMVVRGGFNVYPAEVEAVLVSHAVVHQAVVIGRPDAQYGEEIVAIVVLRPGAAFDAKALENHCRTQLSPTKIPRLWAVVPQIPQGPSGKLLRRAIRAEVLDGKISLERAPA